MVGRPGACAAVLLWLIAAAGGWRKHTHCRLLAAEENGEEKIDFPSLD